MAQIAGDAAPSRKPMSEGELKGILNAKVTNSLGYYGGKLSKARVTALQYYQGEPFGNELDGRSQVVSRDVAEAIDSMMPSLMKIFTSGEEVVRFDATSPEKEPQAQQATDYINWIWQQQNEGFQIFYIWFKDSLLNRTCAVKIWWDEQEEVAKETYKGLTDAEFALLMEDTEEEKLELVSHEEYADQLAAAMSPPPASAAPPGAGGASPASLPGQAGKQPNAPQVAGPMALGMPAGAPPGVPAGMPSIPGIGHNMPPEPMPPAMLHDVVVRRTNKVGRVRILPIPGEEFLMDRRAVSLDDTPFCAHRQKKTISDLVEMGYDYDLVKNLGEGDSSDFNLERLERFRQEDELPYRQGNNYDPSMKEVWINECYLKVDYDGDGIAELRKITFAGESGNFAPGATVILDNEEIDDHPFAAVTPIPMPHKFYGMSIADQTMDLQLIKSTLFRTALDHGYNAIMPQLGVVTEQVNIDDLLTRRPGGIVRMKSPDAITPIPAGQLGVDPFQLISYVDAVREQRTGVQRFSAGPGADALNNAYTDTATGANLVENSSQERLELIARTFAEIGVKPAFKKILKLVTMHQNKPRIIRLRGKYVVMDPREWDDEFDASVSVGLGTGNRQQQLQGMGMLLQMDQQIAMAQKGMNGPLLTWEGIYHKLEKLCQYMGLKTAAPYYQDPATAPPQPQQQASDPAVQAAQIKAQTDMQKAQMDAQSQERIEMARLAVNRQIEIMKIAAAREEFNAEAHMKIAEKQADLALENKRFEHDQHRANQEDDFKRRTTPEYVQPPAPKVMRVTVHRHPEGGMAGFQRHYSDGTSEMVPIERPHKPGA